MQRIIIIIYAIITGAIAVASSILQTQPALFFIDLFAPHTGDTYSPKLVMLLTWIVLLIPLLLFIIIAKLMRKKGGENIAPNRTGIFVTRKKSFQSALVGIPVNINDQKASVVDNGKTKFFDCPAGMLSVQAGYGKQLSEKIETNISEGKQLRFELEIVQVGMSVKLVLKQI